MKIRAFRSISKKIKAFQRKSELIACNQVLSMFESGRCEIESRYNYHTGVFITRKIGQGVRKIGLDSLFPVGVVLFSTD